MSNGTESASSFSETLYLFEKSILSIEVFVLLAKLLISLIPRGEHGFGGIIFFFPLLILSLIGVSIFQAIIIPRLKNNLTTRLIFDISLSLLFYFQVVAQIK